MAQNNCRQKTKTTNHFIDNLQTWNTQSNSIIKKCNSTKYFDFTFELKNLLRSLFMLHSTLAIQKLLGLADNTHTALTWLIVISKKNLPTGICKVLNPQFGKRNHVLRLKQRTHLKNLCDWKHLIYNFNWFLKDEEFTLSTMGRNESCFWENISASEILSIYHFLSCGACKIGQKSEV